MTSDISVATKQKLARQEAGLSMIFPYLRGLDDAIIVVVSCSDGI